MTIIVAFTLLSLSSILFFTLLLYYRLALCPFTSVRSQKNECIVCTRYALIEIIPFTTIEATVRIATQSDNTEVAQTRRPMFE